MDALRVHALIEHKVPLLVCKYYKLFHVLWIKCVPDVEEIGTIALSPFCVLVMKLFGHLIHLQSLIIQALHGDLVVLTYIHKAYLIHLEEPLLVSKQGLEVNLGDHVDGWEVILSREKIVRIQERGLSSNGLDNQ